MNRTSWILSGVVLGFVVGFPGLTAADARDEAPERVSKPVVLVLDASGSMNEDGRWERLIDAAVALIVAMPADCELAVIRFSSTPSVSVPLTRLTAPARHRVLDSIQQLPAPGGITDILAAVGAAFDVLGAGGGHVIVFSDGVQTDPQGHAMPESAWLEPASRLTADARRHQRFVHSVALGPEAAADLLLQKLANHTGGGFHAVRCPQDLVSEFVGLASEIGRFWRRSDAGEFSVPHSMEVIQVVAAGRGPQLFSVGDGRRIPVDPELCVERDQVRAERFLLPPGLYAFQPAGESELLRPMEIDWHVPGNLQPPAGRRTDLEIGISTPGDQGAAEMRVAVGLQYDESQSDEHTAVVSPKEGTIWIPVAWPKVLGSFVGQVTIEQGGWRCVAGRIWGRLVPPDPLQVTVHPTGHVGTDGIELLTRATDEAGRLDLAIDAATQGRDLTLHVRSTHPRLRITPADVPLRDGAQRVALQLDLPGDREPGAVVSTDLFFDASADALVHPQINGQRELQLALRWTYAPPSFLDQLWQWMLVHRWPLLGFLAAILVAAPVTLRRSVVQVRISPGDVSWSFGWMHLGRKLGRPQLKLRLSRRVLHRGRRDHTADTVCLDRPDGSSCELAPGYREPVFRGDSIEVIAEDGARWEIDILSGVERSAPDLDSFEPDGRSGELPDALSQPVAGRFSP